jgi:hypothetical protein
VTVGQVQQRGAQLVLLLLVFWLLLLLLLLLLLEPVHGKQPCDDGAASSNGCQQAYSSTQEHPRHNTRFTAKKEGC